MEFYILKTASNGMAKDASKSGISRSATRLELPSRPVDVFRDLGVTEEMIASRPSRSKLGVEPLEFDAGVVGRELPIGFGVMLVSMACQAATSLSRDGLLGMRRSRHWLVRTASSDSAMSSQLPCL